MAKNSSQKNSDKESKEEKIEKKTVQRLEKRIITKTSTLIMSAFGLVTALAWNDAVQTTFNLIFGKQSELWAKYIYAFFLTVVVVLIAVWLDRIAKNILKEEKQAGEDDE